MAEPLRFVDGGGYEEMMGKWSRPAGSVFLDWLAPEAGKAWIDVGCGTGAFTALIAERLAPSSILGVDPSPAQLSYARTRPGLGDATFAEGGAMHLPAGDSSFDGAVMALSLFFVPEPDKGVAELRRVTRPGGVIAAYNWDVPGGGFPWEPLWAEMRALGVTVNGPPRADVSTREPMQELWEGAGLIDVETRIIEVEREFDNFAAYWAAVQGPPIGLQLMSLPEADRETIRSRLEAKLPTGGDGRIVAKARARRERSQAVRHVDGECKPKSARTN